MKVYLNKAFLVNFLLMDSGEDIYLDIKKFLTSVKSGAEIILNFDFEEAYQDVTIGPLFKQISQKFLKKESYQNFDFLKACENPSFFNNSERHMFFVDEVPGLDIEQKFGCFVATSTTIKKVEVLFQVSEIRVNRRYENWNFLKTIKHSCNALVITDNYLFSNDSSRENLFSILNNLMPDNLNENFQFHLTIIGDSEGNTESLRIQSEKLQMYLSIQFSYEVNLTILRKKHHDRYIFTNYFRITSPRGFSLFTNRTVKETLETTLDLKPVTYFNGNYLAETVFKEELSKCRTINIQTRRSDQFAGNKINRLLM